MTFSLKPPPPVPSVGSDNEDIIILRDYCARLHAWADRMNQQIKVSVLPERTPPTSFGLLFGAPDSFTADATKDPLVNYPRSATQGEEFSIDPVAGTITINENGVYTVTAWAIGDQGNALKEESMILGLRSVGGGGVDADLWVFDIATDKTSLRSFTARIIRPVTAAPITLELVLSATADLGTFTFVDSEFAIEKR